MTERFICPACERKATLKHHVVHADYAQLFFQCRHDVCRNHFQVLRMRGQADRVVAQSPRRVTTLTAEDATPLVGRMGCPQCLQYGKIKMTERRDDGYWRRHKCLTCGPYYTCEAADGTVTVHQHKRSKIAQDLVGEDA